ncbi:MAG: peptidyl-prolyl cis-trans isomerase [Nitrospirae bacterium]|nr:peptidyl-prolyl cis-trans isomerase [Nitrospirota bacterium]
MKQLYLALILIFISNNAIASDAKLPLIDGKETLATVNGGPITLEEFNTALAQIHSAEEANKSEGKHAGKIDYKGVLDRLINSKLIVTEARNIGLDELPEVKEMAEKNAKNTLIGLLKGFHVRDMQVDEEEADRLYKEAVMEMKLKAALFKNEADAKKVEAEIKAGGNFDDILKKVIADGIAKGGAQGEYIKGIDLLPQITEAAAKMETGSVSPAIKIQQEYIIFRIEDKRFPDNQEAKDKAGQQALKYKKDKALEKYRDSLIEKYVKVNTDIFNSLDYETTPEEFEKMLKDERVVAEIEGEKPLTVRELTEALQQKYFHGVESAIKGKKLNEKKKELFHENLLQRMVFIKEALRQRIDKTEVYKNLTGQFEDSLLFDTFISRVVVPDIDLDEKEIEKYYKDNIKDFSSPEMMKIHGIAFKKRDDAENAVEKLRKGVEFKWLSANAEGRADSNAPELLNFEGNTLLTSEFPEELKKAVSGAKAGDFRFYAGPEGYFYALYIENVLPSSAMKLDEVRRDIAKIIFNDKLERSVDDWVDKLKKVYKVKIFATDL